MRTPIQWFVDWLYEQFERKDRARAWQRSTLTQQQAHPERVTDAQPTLVDLYDTCPIQRVVNASAPVSVPPEPAQRPPGSTTNVLRKYYVPHKDTPPGNYVRIYKVLSLMGMLPRSGGTHDR
jgi:hypothetical protein